MNEDKDQAWKRVTNAYNAVAVERRTLEQLRAKFDNLKTKTRKIVAANRFYLKGTGGGGALPEFNPVIELMLKIINLKTVVGLDSEFDCDNDGGESKQANKENNSVMVNVVDSETLFATISDDQVILEMKDSAVVNGCTSEIIVTDNNGEELSGLQETLVAGVAAQEVPKKAEEPLSDRKRTWKKYTSRRLKEPVSKKLRPTISIPVYDKKQEYYTKKGENVDEERIARKAQEKRLAEEHEGKMQLLALEIRLKQEELKLKYNASV